MNIKSIKNIKINSILFFSILFGGTVNTAVASGANVESNNLLAKEGREVYDAFCIRCHGPKMVNPGTITYDLRKFPHDQRSRFINSVTNGKRQMPPWGRILSQEEIASIWEYVLTKGKL